MKIKASSILESMLAMVIVGIVISTAITLFVSLPKDSFLERNQLAYSSCSTWFEETMISKEFLDDKRTYDSFVLIREVSDFPKGNTLIQVKVEARDKFGELITSRQQIVKKE